VSRSTGIALPLRMGARGSFGDSGCDVLFCSLGRARASQDLDARNGRVRRISTLSDIKPAISPKDGGGLLHGHGRSKFDAALSATGLPACRLV